MVRQVAVPAEARALSTLPQIDYADAFAVGTGLPSGWTPQRWLRLMLEGAPLPMRKVLRWAWTGLGLRLGPDAAGDFVLGWRVLRSEPDHVLVGATSRIGMPAELLLVHRDSTLLFDTFVRHENVLARILWAGTEPGHVPVVRRMLESAARKR
jgi:hypothetical protein